GWSGRGCRAQRRDDRSGPITGTVKRKGWRGVQQTMATKLTHEIRREIDIDGEAYTVVISPQGLRLSRKRFRSGRSLSWRALWRRGGADEPHESMVPVTGDTAPV